MNKPPSPSRRALSTTVIEAVAEEMDTNPEDLPKPLYETINPDALDALFTGRNSTDGVVTFTYCDYDVTVTAGGEVSVEN